MGVSRPRLGQLQPAVAQCEREAGGAGVGQRVLRLLHPLGGPGRLRVLPAVAEGPGVLPPDSSQPAGEPVFLPALLHRHGGPLHDEVPALRPLLCRRTRRGRHLSLGLRQPLSSEVQVSKQHFKVGS